MKCSPRIFYDESRKYAFQNHRANYALGAIKSSQINFEGAHYNYTLRMQ